MAESESPQSRFSMKAFVSIALLKLTAALPLAVSQALGRGLGRLMYWLPNRNRDVARLNLGWCFPQWDAATRERMLRLTLQHLGMIAMEGGPVWLWPPEKLGHYLKSVEGEQHFLDAMAKGKGVILVTPHLGNWEIMPIWLTQHTKMCALYKTAKLSDVDRYIRSSRERLGVEMAAAGHGGVKTLLTSLKAGKTLIVLADHEPSKGTGVFVPFFGVNSYTGVLVPRLAQKTGAAIIMVAAERLPRAQGFRLHLAPGPDVSELSDEAAALALNQAMEQRINLFPEQFMWNYKRFRTQPAEAANPYKAAAK